MTPKQAIAIVTSGRPNLQVVSVKNYQSDYLVTAFEDQEELDPFYLVNKANGSMRKYTIADDLDRYYNTPDVEIK